MGLNPSPHSNLQDVTSVSGGPIPASRNIPASAPGQTRATNATSRQRALATDHSREGAAHAWSGSGLAKGGMSKSYGGRVAQDWQWCLGPFTPRWPVQTWLTSMAAPPQSLLGDLSPVPPAFEKRARSSEMQEATCSNEKRRGSGANLGLYRIDPRSPPPPASCGQVAWSIPQFPSVQWGQQACPPQGGAM